jgi:hypothetical protein
MKNIKILSAVLATAAAFTALPAAAQPAAPPAAPRCLDVKNIRDTVTKDDGATLTFRLTNGTTVVNHLKTKCDSLKFGGFVWETAPGGEICANTQMLRAITTGELCRLGNFDAPVKMTSTTPATR